ncbi:MAG TPA: hypothetical protein VMT61_17665 [Candidatus Binataceae bacterium]|nr:hypothetical protein [Candidatus Binataceae bacterium]
MKAGTRERYPTAMAIALAVFFIVASVRCGAASNQQTASVAALERMAHVEFGALSAAELRMLQVAPTRDIAWASTSTDPNAPINDPAKAATWGPERTIRSAMIEWLLSNPEAAKLVHPSGLAVKAARITGKLDLSYLTINTPLMLVLCAISDGIDLRYSHYQSLDVRASWTGAIVGDQSVSTGDVVLRYGRYADASFYRAEIGGNLEANGGNFIGDEPLSVVDATVKGDALFHEDFETSGVVDFRLARIGRSLSFNHAHFTGKNDNGLNAERATIGGTLYWVDIEGTPKTQLDLEDARAKALWDDRKSWPAAGNLSLDGFVYSEFSGGPGDSESRLEWLRLQPLVMQKQPQPYRQLADVLRAAGRPEGAINVEVAHQDALRRLENLGFTDRLWRAALDVTIGYGYRPLRALWWILLFVALGGVLFRSGYRARLITPTEAEAYDVFVKTGEPPPHYPPFNSFVYSLENFLPVVDLHQGTYWRPNPRHTPMRPGKSDAQTATFDRLLAPMLRWYLWLHILAGWTITPLLFAGLAGLLRND